MSTDAQSVGFMVHSVWRLLRRLADGRLKPLGLSSAHMPVIGALMNGEELSQKALAEAAAVEQPSMAELLARMERDGLICRRRDPADKRGSLARLSPELIEKLPEIRVVIESINRDALAGLGEAGAKAFYAIMSGLVGSLEQALKVPDRSE